MSLIRRVLVRLGLAKPTPIEQIGELVEEWKKIKCRSCRGSVMNGWGVIFENQPLVPPDTCYPCWAAETPKERTSRGFEAWG